jgi:hypothetical protein
VYHNHILSANNNHPLRPQLKRLLNALQPSSPPVRWPGACSRPSESLLRGVTPAGLGPTVSTEVGCTAHSRRDLACPALPCCYLLYAIGNHHPFTLYGIDAVHKNITAMALCPPKHQLLSQIVMGKLYSPPTPPHGLKRHFSTFLTFFDWFRV